MENEIEKSTEHKWNQEDTRLEHHLDNWRMTWKLGDCSDVKGSDMKGLV